LKTVETRDLRLPVRLPGTDGFPRFPNRNPAKNKADERDSDYNQLGILLKNMLH